MSAWLSTTTWLKVSRCTRTGEISRERKGMDIRFYGWCSNNCSPGSVELEGLASLERQSPSSPQSMLSSSMTSRSLVLKLEFEMAHNLTKSSLSRRCCNLPQCQHVPMSCHPTQRLVFFHVSGLLNICNGAMLNMIFLRHRTSQGLWPRRRGKTRWKFFLFRDCQSLLSNNVLSILISTIFRWSTWRISCSRGVSAPLKGWRHALNISTLMSIGQFYFPGDSLKPPYHGFIVDRNQFYVFTLSQCWRSVNEDQS